MSEAAPRVRTGQRTIPASASDAVTEAVSVLRGGGIIALPTDTVYGFAAAIDRPDALDRLYVLKGRPLAKAIPVLLGAAPDVSLVARGLPAPAMELAERYWPGALTLVVAAREGLPDPITSRDEQGTTTVAVRVPDDPTARDVITATGGALAVTSANRSGDAPALATSALGWAVSKVDLVIDGGPVRGGIPSTIVRVGNGTVEVLREGAIPARAIRDLLSSGREIPGPIRTGAV